MLTTTENALERLVALVGEHSDLNGAQVLDLWAKELTQERQKQEARRTALADEALYYVARIESQPTLNEQLQEVSLQPRKVERLAIKYSDLPRFAKSRGIPYPDLMDLLELRVGELVDHWGARWVQDHPRSMYIDRSAREAERAKEAEEDRQHAESLARRTAVREANKVVAVTKEYK